MLPSFSAAQWALAIVAGVGIGLAKSGLAGMGLVPVLIFASLVGARDSTGVMLPLLIVGDVLAAVSYREHAQWTTLGRMLPPAAIGIAAGAWMLRDLDAAEFRPVLGWIIIGLALLHFVRARRPEWFGRVPHSLGFAWAVGLLAGMTTMLANAAGPIIVLYALAIGLPKLAFAGTIGWFFLVVNLFKVPFSVGLGLLDAEAVLLTLVLSPAVASGLFAGRWVVQKMPQQVFNYLLLAFSLVAALRLIGAL